MDAVQIHPFREGNLTGLRSGSGEVVLPPTYERIDPFFGSYAKIVHDGKQGLIDRKGRLALGKLFDSVTVRPWGRKIKYIYIITSDGKKGFIPDGTNRFSGFRFDIIGHLVDGRAIVSNERRFGFIDEEGSIAVPLRYFEVENFLNGRATVVGKKGWECIDPHGNPLQQEDDPFIPLLKPHPVCWYLPTYDDPEGQHFIPLRWRKFLDPGAWNKYRELTPGTVWFARGAYEFYLYNTAGRLQILDDVTNFEMISHDLMQTYGSKYFPESGSANLTGVRNIFGEVIIPEAFQDLSYYSGQFRVEMGGCNRYLLPSGVFVYDKKEN